ncbi:uncharacterized protein [Branchiostoma lanceolatum]|uniref:uncharacterized protein n=1 Tax=Branchiostoma lanceolatum TaxID=7740 RepID=UPI00345549FB
MAGVPSTSTDTGDTTTLDHFKLWHKDRLVAYLRERGLPVTGDVNSLKALAFGATVMRAPLVPTPQEEQQKRCEDYRSLLTIDGKKVPDPLVDLKSGWQTEGEGMQHWPPTMYADMAEYLVASGEVDLRKRLMGDYKDGKAFSYFDANFIHEVLYHPISDDSDVCFVKSTSARSQRKNDEPHQVWVALQKSTGKVRTAYCSCFAGLGSSCNHVAGVLFKMDHAWTEGITNKSCTSKPAEWPQPKKGGSTDAKKIKNMEWWSPNWSKGKKKQPINTPTRRLFSPTKNTSPPSLEGLMSDLYVSSKDACAFKYAMPTTTNAYPVEDDINVEEVIDLVTCESVPLPLSELIKLPTLPTFSTEQVNALVEATMEQSSNPTWRQQRIGRVTASVARSVMVMAKKVQSDALIAQGILDGILGRKKETTVQEDDLDAIKFGRRMEPIAREAYIKVMRSTGHKGLTAQETGLFVLKDQIYIGASPDGLVTCQCCEPPNGLLEIKCPYSIAWADPKAIPPSYLRNKEGPLALRHMHGYYSQVQMQMMVTNTEWCDFFVYTNHGYYLERVLADKKHQEELRAAASVVFEQLIRPGLQHPSQNTTDASGSLHGDTQSPSKDHETPGNVDCPESAHPVSTPADTVHPPESTSRDDPPAPPPAKKRRVTATRQKKKAGPIYLCGICNSDCVDDVEDEDENSVACDICNRWFHWGCVGFETDDLSDDWYCDECQK